MGSPPNVILKRHVIGVLLLQIGLCFSAGFFRLLRAFILASPGDRHDCFPVIRSVPLVSFRIYKAPVKSGLTFR